MGSCRLAVRWGAERSTRSERTWSTTGCPHVDGLLELGGETGEGRKDRARVPETAAMRDRFLALWSRVC
jgi:hypothetical protein